MTSAPWRYIASDRADDTGGLMVFASDDNGNGWQVVSEQRGIPSAIALAVHPSGRAVYVASSADGGSIVALAVAPDASLSELGWQPSGGESPCSVRVDPSGRFLVTTNFDSATLAVHPIDLDLRLGAPSDIRSPAASEPVGRSNPPHLHQAVFAPDSDLILVTDLGRNALYSYRIGADGRLVAATPHTITAPAGSGPRHLVFHPDGSVVVSDELSSTISVYRNQPDTGFLTWSVAASTVESQGGAPNYPSDLLLSADGRFCYVGNRGHNTIGVLNMEGDQPTLIQEAAAGGRWPQHLALFQGRLYCALRDDDAIVAMTPDRVTGRLGAPEPVAVVAGVSWIATGPSGAGEPPHQSPP